MKLVKFLKEEVESRIALKSSFQPTGVLHFCLDFGDPYIDQIFENSKLVAEKLGLSSEQYTTLGRVK